MHEHEIETKLKQGISDIHPDRSLFEQTLTQARGTQERYDVPSPYQFQFSSLMRKMAYVGAPVVVLVLVTLFTFQGDAPQKESVQVSPVNSAQSMEEKKTIANALVQKPLIQESVFPQTSQLSEDASVDDVMQGFLAEAEVDAALAMNDSFDAEYLYTELGAIPEINAIDYENLI